MTTPEDLDAHGRAWAESELVNKDWDDLWRIWWKCVKERNWLSTDANERSRVDAGYGDAEGQERDGLVSSFPCFWFVLDGTDVFSRWFEELTYDDKHLFTLRYELAVGNCLNPDGHEHEREILRSYTLAFTHVKR